jgi:hypothetical protein
MTQGEPLVTQDKLTGKFRIQVCWLHEQSQLKRPDYLGCPVDKVSFVRFLYRTKADGLRLIDRWLQGKVHQSIY